MFYWLILLIVIGISFFIKKDSKFSLLMGFYIFCGGAILGIIGLNEVAEILIRISFISWVVGLALAIRELH